MCRNGVFGYLEKEKGLREAAMASQKLEAVHQTEVSLKSMSHKIAEFERILTMDLPKDKKKEALNQVMEWDAASPYFF